MSNIFVSCGEVSGDIYAGGFIREALKISPSTKLWGMLGPESVKAGGVQRWSYDELKLMGLLEIVPAIPRILRLKKNIAREILTVNPESVVLVDSPDFHLMLAKSLRKCGYTGRIISLSPPTVWAWRSGRVKNLKRDFDLCLPLFSFEHEYLLSHGVKSLWKSHPLVREIEGVRISEAFTKRFGHENIIALMPGSRHYDIRFHLDILIGTAEILKARGYLPVFSVAPGLSSNLANEVRERAKESGHQVWEGSGRELMLGSVAVAGVSGTVAVEAMLLGKFMTVIYNMRRLNYAVLKRLVRVKDISIPNILAGRRIYPELLCGEATPENIAREIERYLDDDDMRRKTDSAMKEARAMMGEYDAPKFWAECIINPQTKSINV
ncbi:MAG: lipid-A-disaccharide synthase [Synergistaceae bacterium]|nr:lipid-A-disaccharide synthase [Synergistaceae bacterium]